MELENTKSAESQTTLESEDWKYPSKDIIDLGEHQFACHGSEIESEQISIKCYLCGWKVASKHDLMVHRKEKTFRKSPSLHLLHPRNPCIQWQWMLVPTQVCAN